jgi:hypothetical protein
MIHPENQDEFDELLDWVKNVLPGLPPTVENSNLITQKYKRLNELTGTPSLSLAKRDGESSSDYLTRVEAIADDFLAQ